ncbi:MAG: hypothetical protein JSR39_07925, partial [Verrucomicrobia bacterium]|nr:hypothetical protein [Verrucomicrobiota bacterium]
GAQAHQYVKKVFFDANVKKSDDVKNFDGLPISLGVRSIREMINNLNGQANFITICGHGGPGVQGLGSKRNYEYTPGLDFCVDALDDVGNEINLLYNYLLPNPVPGAVRPSPVVFLAGCSVGEGEDGTRLLRQLSARMPEVLIVASGDKLTYKKNRMSVQISKLWKAKPSTNPIDFKYAFNGRLVQVQNIQDRTGHDSGSLEQELTQFN